MKIVIAPDSFKGNLSAKAVAEAIQAGCRRALPHADVVLVPMADGGDGTLAALINATGGRRYQAKVQGPLQQNVTAAWGILGDEHTAVIEMAQAAGLQYVQPQLHPVMTASTFGVGQLIEKALDAGCQKLIIGLGGSATNDGGAGMAQALGVRLLDANGQDLEPGGAALQNLTQVDVRGLDPRLAHVQLILASDVTSPLCGPTGASMLFGRQKGATPAMRKSLDQALQHFAQCVKQALGKDASTLPGSGAAGGLGFGLLAFTNSRLQPGIDVVIHYSKLEEKAQGADLVFTGEGGIDGQTQFGKTPVGVAAACKKAAPQAPVVALAGSVAPSALDLTAKSQIDALFAIPSGAKTLPEAISDSRQDLAGTAENVTRLAASLKR